MFLMVVNFIVWICWNLAFYYRWIFIIFGIVVTFSNKLSSLHCWLLSNKELLEVVITHLVYREEESVKNKGSGCRPHGLAVCPAIVNLSGPQLPYLRL